MKTVMLRTKCGCVRLWKWDPKEGYGIKVPITPASWNGLGPEPEKTESRDFHYRGEIGSYGGTEFRVFEERR